MKELRDNGLFVLLVLAEAPKRAWKFAANEEFKGLILSAKGSVSNELTLTEFSLAGALAGVSEALVNCPFETVKVRMQSKEFVSKFKGSMECLAYLIRNEGLTSVYVCFSFWCSGCSGSYKVYSYKGLEAQMWRNGVWNGAYFGVQGYAQLLREMDPPVERTKQEVLGEKFVCGAVGSMLGTLLNTPFDVAKSRLQLQNTPAGERAKYRWTFQTLSVIQQEEGFSALYKGLGARILRLAPGGGIMIVVVDFVSNLLRDF